MVHFRWPLLLPLIVLPVLVVLWWPESDRSCAGLPEPWMVVACTEAEATHGAQAPACARSSAAEAYQLWRETSVRPDATWPRRFRECLERD